MPNTNLFLQYAKKNKLDEFYTLYEDIDKELQHYKPYFKDKIVCCPCDNPLKSNFYKWFADNFESLGLKKLITSCYVPYHNSYGLFDSFVDSSLSLSLKILISILEDFIMFMMERIKSIPLERI